MEPERPSRARRFSWPLVFIVCFFIAALVGVFLFWRLETWPIRATQAGSAELERLGRKARDAFVDLAGWQPRITIRNRVYFEQTRGVAELAILSRQTEVEHEFFHTWAGSSKRIKLHGTFHVKAGFDLGQDLTVDVRESEIVVNLPHAKILSLELQQTDVLEFENGLWNRISAADLEQELAALPALAREKTLQSDLLAETEAALEKQLQDRLGTERPLRLVFPPATTPKP